MLLVRHFVGGLDRHGGGGPAGIEVALAGAHRFVQVGADAFVGVHERCVGRQRCIQIGHDRKRLPLDLDGGRGGTRLRQALGDDQRQVVGLPARHVARHLAAARVFEPDEDRLVELGQPVLVAGHVGRAEHCDDTR